MDASCLLIIVLTTSGWAEDLSTSISKWIKEVSLISITVGITFKIVPVLKNWSVTFPAISRCLILKSWPTWTRPSCPSTTFVNGVANTSPKLPASNALKSAWTLTWLSPWPKGPILTNALKTFWETEEALNELLNPPLYV